MTDDRRQNGFFRIDNHLYISHVTLFVRYTFRITIYDTLTNQVIIDRNECPLLGTVAICSDKAVLRVSNHRKILFFVNSLITSSII
jgi:hypothetical protein